jgi:hypothetical protein
MLYDENDRLRSFAPIWTYKPGWYVVCKKCGKRIDIFEDILSKEALTKIIDLVETHRSEEFIGREERFIDNVQSQSEINRKLTIQREWFRAVKIETEKSADKKHGMRVGRQNVAEATFTAEEAVRQRYSVSREVRLIYTEEVAVAVPPGTKVRLIFDWKYIWQHGLVTINVGDSAAKFRFSVIVGVTFDQQQVSL